MTLLLPADCTFDQVKIKKKKGSGKKKGMAPITKAEPCESFFNFFKPPVIDNEVVCHLSSDCA